MVEDSCTRGLKTPLEAPPHVGAYASTASLTLKPIAQRGGEMLSKELGEGGQGWQASLSPEQNVAPSVGAQRSAGVRLKVVLVREARDEKQRAVLGEAQ